MRRFALSMSIAGAVLLATAAPLTAQGYNRGNGGVPPGHRPPPGMCRIWIDGVPPGQQPAPTDCASAVRNRPSNGRVIFGDDAGGRGRGKGKEKGSQRGGDDVYDDRDQRDDRTDRTDRTTDRGDRSGTWGDILRGRTPDSCTDRDRDGRCDVPSTTGVSGSLPSMVAGVLIARGQRTADVNRWLGGGDFTARVSDVDRNGVPARVMWYDQAGQLVQLWTDRDRDGRADRVEQFVNGRRVRVTGN